DISTSTFSGERKNSSKKRSSSGSKLNNKNRNDIDEYTISKNISNFNNGKYNKKDNHKNNKNKDDDFISIYGSERAMMESDGKSLAELSAGGSSITSKSFMSRFNK